MAFTVRLFGHDGLVRMPVVGASQFSSDSVYQLRQPYTWAQQMTTNGVTPVSSVAPTLRAGGAARDTSTILRIEVPDGQAIRYEVNGPGSSVAASVNSPVLTGRDQIQWGVGFTLSIIDATGTT
jgi:hypothetical protein